MLVYSNQGAQPLSIIYPPNVLNNAARILLISNAKRSQKKALKVTKKIYARLGLRAFAAAATLAAADAAACACCSMEAV